MGVINGKRIVYLYRILKDAATDDATAIAFTTENERTKSRDADTTETKDGPIRTPGALETEITATALFASENDEMIDKLEKAVDNIELQLQNSLEKEVTSLQIGELAMEALKKIDDVAYVRFASVYRQFKDLHSFMEELSQILEENQQ